MDLRVTVDDSFESVSPVDWERLWNRARQANIFQTLNWYVTWARHYVPPERLRLLSVWDATRLVGAAALYICDQRRYSIGRRKILTFLSSYSSAYAIDQGCLIDREAEEEVLLVLASAIVKLRGFDAVAFELFSDMSLNRALLNEVAKQIDTCVTYRIRAISHIVGLAKTYEEFLAGLGSSTRKNLSKYAKRFLADEGCNVETVKSAEELSELLEALRRQKSKRLATKGVNSSFDDNRFYSFLKEVLTNLFDEGQVWGLIARVKGDIAATQLILFDRHEHSFAYNSSFDMKYANMRLHYVLEGLRFREAISRGYLEMELFPGHDYHKRHYSLGKMRELMEGAVVVRRIGNARFWLVERILGRLKREKREFDEFGAGGEEPLEEGEQN